MRETTKIAVPQVESNDYIDDDDVVPYYNAKKYEELKMKITSNAIRHGVFVLFVNKYKALDNVVEGADVTATWGGKGGLISKIRKDLGLSKDSYSLRPILLDIVDCARCGKGFEPCQLEHRRGHRPIQIQADSMEAQIIADCLESGLSVEKTKEILNNHLLELGKDGHTKSAIQSLMLRLNPKIERITKRKQGSKDPNNPWSRARLLWSKQLLIRFGEMPSDTTQPRFNRAQTGSLHLDQVVWWDETHRKCLIGGLTTNRHFTMKFKRNEDGKLDATNGKYDEKRIQILNCKYEKECRLGLGCAMVSPKDPNNSEQYLPVTGKRCPPFDYSEKVLLSVADYEKKMAAEFRRVKSLGNKAGYWIEAQREDDVLYSNDKLDLLKGVGKVMKKKLEDNGFKVLGDFKTIGDPDSLNLVGITKKAFKKAWEQAKDCSPQLIPSPIDHRKADNPYQSKFGDQWEKHLRQSNAFSTCIVVTEYIEFMMEQSAAVMKGTKHEDDWYVYHDSLSIMTAEKTKKWMREKGYLQRWILPTDDLYCDDPELKKRYSNNPLGNSPELMPWDTHLNQDVHSSHDFHVVSTSHLPEDHPNKFSGSTPKRMAQSYKRILDPTVGVSPSPPRIIQDVQRIIASLKLIFDAKGVLINENVKGRRFVNKDENEPKKWGGKRVKKKITHRDIRLHPLAEAESKNRLTESIKKLDGATATIETHDDPSVHRNIDDSSMKVGELFEYYSS